MRRIASLLAAIALAAGVLSALAAHRGAPETAALRAAAPPPHSI